MNTPTEIALQLIKINHHTEQDEDLEDIHNSIQQLIPHSLNKYQTAALISLIHDIGLENFTPLLQTITSHTWTLKIKKEWRLLRIDNPIAGDRELKLYFVYNNDKIINEL